MNNTELARKFMMKTCGTSNTLSEKYMSNQTPTTLITQTNFKQIINCRKSSAPYFDDITYDHLKYLNAEVRDNIIIDMNKIWQKKTIPEELNETKIIAIRNKNKDAFLAEGWRPISLISVMTKVINIAVLQIFREELYEKNVIPDMSFGFRKGYSTTSLSYIPYKYPYGK